MRVAGRSKSVVAPSVSPAIKRLAGWVGAATILYRANVPTAGRVSMRVYYLTGPMFGVAALALKRLKVARINDLNDPAELLAVSARNATLRAALNHLKDRLHHTVGLVCFSRDWTSPVLWSHYAERHTGMALGFDVPDQKVTAVQYTAAKRRASIDRATGSIRNAQALGEYLTRTKFDEWSYEREVRMFVELATSHPQGGLHFFDFESNLVLREVVLGARCTLPKDRVVQLVSTMAQPATVVKARMAFGKFSVTRDLRSVKTDPK